ncbi:MAG: hypothetical protein QF492_02050 [Candidatus Krumholzibacteria bacterium]|jgi:hypothetical protein|nr:hypothetical protein [Candidatus Krumholzibacteria bacterium]MDP6668678.1 hypothetical protein [Candidatus Krumholzibacteria bacterium]MDP6797893.1 hypothetical protein [Candidatus Krumholzibacteria bacterium]MDP7021771.1 hypothetical protein [Candidatus Krumholzibacteria bacterium]
MPKRLKFQNPVARSIPLLTMIATLLLPASVGAAWTEGDDRILSLDEAMVELGGDRSVSLRSSLPGDTPIVLMDGDGNSIQGSKALAVALVQSGLSLRADGDIVSSHAFTERERAERRRYPQFSIAPSARADDAINAGGAVLYGKTYAPPFRIEVIQGEIRLNQVTIYPAPGPSAAAPKATAAQIEAHQRNEALFAAYDAEKNARGAQAAREAVSAGIASDSRFQSSRWLDDGSLTVVMPDGTEETFRFDVEQREPDANNDSVMAEHLKSLADDLRAALERDYTVVAGASYVTTTSSMDAGSLRRRVDEILYSAEPEALKLARLHVITGHREAAADLLYLR